MSLIDSDKDFKILCQDMDGKYKRAPKEEFRIKADRFREYFLVNRSGRLIKKGEIKFAEGLLAKNQKIV